MLERNKTSSRSDSSIDAAPDRNSFPPQLNQEETLQFANQDDPRASDLKFSLLYLDHCKTTMSVRTLCNQASIAFEPGVAVCCGVQTGGVGYRRGTRFHTTPVDLKFTTVLPLVDDRAEEAVLLSVGVTQAVQQGIQRVLRDSGMEDCADRVHARWRNDVWLSQASSPSGFRKLSGVLSVHRSDPERGEVFGEDGVLVCGVGVNLSRVIEDLAEEPEQLVPPGSLEGLTGTLFSREQILGSILFSIRQSIFRIGAEREEFVQGMIECVPAAPGEPVEITLLPSGASERLIVCGTNSQGFETDRFGTVPFGLIRRISPCLNSNSTD